MASVNEAYEVLSNPGYSLHPDLIHLYLHLILLLRIFVELRQRFDVGDDPNDPMAQQGGHPFAGGFGADHPFAQFFQQTGGGFPGGNGGFKFHFSG
jgi:DnaJ homolog subfamily C member 3